MAIAFDPHHGTFTIDTDNSTYQMQVDNYGYLMHLYYGARSSGCMDWLLHFVDRGLSANPYDAGDDRTYSLDCLPQEFPVQGTGDHRSPMLIMRDHEGAFGCDMRYRRYEIRKGKYGLSGLPAVYSESDDDDAETLSIVLGNDRTNVEVELLYGVLPHLDIITRCSILTNRGSGMVTVEKLGSACLDFVHGDFDVITFHGRHTLEMQKERLPIPHGTLSVGSRRGYSSHQYNPFLILADHGATETAGKCWSMQFVYSGGFRAEAEHDQYDQVRMMMGMSDEKFSYPVAPGESLTAPEVIMTYSGAGLEKLSQNLHSCIRNHVCRGKYRNVPRPIVINSWEAAYFDFTGEKIIEIAAQAKELGIEMLVLDDGWFGDRSDDFRALGDWKANEEKLGMSLGTLIERVNGLGMKFGIWTEPEMISEDSDLYRAHPDWAMAIPGEKPVRGRNQLVLDFSRREVVDAVYAMMCDVLDQGNIEYMKWDCNRSINDVYSHTATDQGKVLYDYILGLYDLLERLSDRYPDMLIEGCSGGGGRFDCGMLYYTPQIWASDNSDALDRLIIQYGLSFGYPSCTVGAHVSACPNHQTGRTTPLATRAAVAMSGTFGYELDPAKLSPAEKTEIRRETAYFKTIADIVTNGTYYRLSDATTDRYTAWEHLSPDRTHCLITVVIPENHGNTPTIYVTPRGLLPGAEYHDYDSGKTYISDALMEAGFPVPQPDTDRQAYMFMLRCKKEE
ncbi:MAG: alpha-galactosidase [Eubacterium sp.]|nr:alpha-galactosidase [Eubacterium sp.]